MIDSYIDYKVIDNFFSDEEHSFALSKCREMPYHWGESEGQSYPPTGMVCDVDENSEFYSLFIRMIGKKFPEFVERIPSKFYINLFAPKEISYYHVDAHDEYTGTTFIYYPQMMYDKNDGGETIFYDENKDMIFGVPPKPNRILKFNSRILHKATSFHSRHRFTVVIKYCDQIS